MLCANWDSCLIHKIEVDVSRGKLSAGPWVLDTGTPHSVYVNPMTGWSSSADVRAQVRMYFATREDAVRYAEANRMDYRILPSNNKKFVKKSYQDNFLR